MSKISLINVNSFKFVAIIPAAGNSERCSNNSIGSTSITVNKLNNSNKCSWSTLANSKRKLLPKQYSIVCNKPLIFHTVTAFLKLKWIDHVIVLAASESINQMENILSSLSKHQKRFDCITGGTTRHRSIKLGLDFIQEKHLQPDFVIVHDGARPYVDENVLHLLVTECYHYGVAGVYCKLISTIIAPKQDTTLDEVLDRNKYVASETPQAFRFNLIIDAYSKCTENELEHNTECLDIVKRYTKFDAKLIPVDPSLYFKVTYKKDLYAADNILKEHRNILLHCEFDCAKPSIDYKFIKQLKDDLIANFANVKYFSDSNKIKNLVQHSPGTVHVLLHYSEHWKIVLEQNLAAYENLVYIVINRDKEDEDLADSAYIQLIQWARSVKSKEIKNFYLIFTHIKNLNAESARIRNIVVYLSKELPMEFSGQVFFT